MSTPAKFNFENIESISILEQEITSLEVELVRLENELNNFQTKIQSALYVQILQIQELTDLYKSQKLNKKLKRLEQKKRGKNYKEPVGISVSKVRSSVENENSIHDQQELKKLFREAIVQIHPDKFVDADDDLNERATAITAKLNLVYQSGNLEELNLLHEHIISGNALNYIPDQPSTVNDPEALMLFLQQKKLKLESLIMEIKSAPIYELFESNRDVSALISELKIAFENRILILKKRTE